MESFDVHGIDVSHYQKQIDWSTVADQNVEFAFIKATEGMSVSDSMFCQNWSEAYQAGIPRGAYHFLRFDCSPEDQAAHFLSYILEDPGELPPVLDIEVKDGAGEKTIVAYAKRWLDLVEGATGVRPIIYSNLRYFNHYLSGHFNPYILWIARYHDSPPALKRGHKWTFWQYGDRGVLPGVETFVDFNVFYGDSLEWQTFLSMDHLTVISELDDAEGLE